MLKIDIWSDYACPYCYIGKKQLFQALHELEIKDYEIKHHVFILEPGKMNHPERSFLEGLHLSESALLQAQGKFKQIEEMAEQVGLHYDMARIRDVGTIDAHRLTLWAQTQNKHMVLNDLLFSAYFEKCEDISNHNLLADYAVQAGLDKQEALHILSDDKAFLEEVFEDFEIAEEEEIDLVPHYTFNQSIEIMGIMTIEAIKKHLQMV